MKKITKFFVEILIISVFLFMTFQNVMSIATEGEATAPAEGVVGGTSQEVKTQSGNTLIMKRSTNDDLFDKNITGFTALTPEEEEAARRRAEEFMTEVPSDLSGRTIPVENYTGYDRDRSESEYHDYEPLTLPEIDVNLHLNYLTTGCKVYLLFPTDLLRFNMQKFVNNNHDNEFQVEKEKSDKIQEYMDNEDYLGYVNFFLNDKYSVKSNEIELRQYCIAIGKNDVVGYIDHEDKKYVQFKINLDDGNYRVILKDYFLQTDCSGIKFMIDEFHTYKYISVSDYPLTQNQTQTNISEYNINEDYTTRENYESINRAIRITYFVLFIVAMLILFFFLRYILKRLKQIRKEREEALFYKHDDKDKDKKKKKEKKEKKKK